MSSSSEEGKPRFLAPGSMMSAKAQQRIHASWLRLDKCQVELIRKSLLLMRNHYPDIFVVWAFGQKTRPTVKTSSASYLGKSMSGSSIRSMITEPFNESVMSKAMLDHAHEVVKTITHLIQHSVERPRDVMELICKLGSRHFYYGVVEPYFDIFIEILFAQIKTEETLTSKWDSKLDRDWKTFLHLVSALLKQSIADEREKYLKNCLNRRDLMQITELWSNFRTDGKLEMLATSWYRESLSLYKQLLEASQTSTVFNHYQKLGPDDVTMITLATETLKLIEKGFQYLPNNAQGLVNIFDKYVNNYYITGICPFYVKQSLKQGFLQALDTQLATKLGESDKTMWSKFFEVIIQAIVTNLIQKNENFIDKIKPQSTDIP